MYLFIHLFFIFYFFIFTDSTRFGAKCFYFVFSFNKH